MSPSWNPSLYRTDEAQSPLPGSAEVARMMAAVPQIEPRNANTLIERASYYLKLNFPELAAGDAYKADLLFERKYDDSVDGATSEKRLRIHNILSQALYDCHCHWELNELRKASSFADTSNAGNDKFKSINDLLARKEQAAVSMGGTPWEIKDRIHDGGVLTVDYPWMSQRHLMRSQELIDAVNEEFTHGDEDRRCYLGRSTLAVANEMLGMFAARDFKLGETILLERTATGACSNIERGACDNCFGRVNGPPIRVSCCTVVYCSLECRDLAIDTYHKALCGKDFSWLQASAQGIEHNASPLRPLLMLRFLALCVQAGSEKHPLDHPLIARLQPLANRSHVDVFTFNKSVVTLTQILEQLGVDNFADHNFETWVLHTIWTRIANNKAGSPDSRRGFIDEISPHLPLFNHSCEPNVEWRRRDSSTTICFFAKRNIEKDEELFSSYLDVKNLSLEERAEALWPWFEGPCLCSKCTIERIPGL